MKAVIIPVVAAALCCTITDADAQSKAKSKKTTDTRSEETIVIKRDDNNGKTTVEIKNGEVYINGDKVANVHNGANSDQKIIIEDNNTAGPVDPPAQMEGRMPFFDRDDMPRRAMLGVYTNTTPNSSGAEIKDVMPGTAAAEAGLKAGDVITAINGRHVADGKQLTEAIAKQEPGDKVAITYERNGEKVETNGMLSKAEPQTAMRSFHYDPYGGGGYNPNGGSNDYEIPNPMVRPFNIDINGSPWMPTPKIGVSAEDLEDGNGVHVVDVKPNSPAAEAGLQKDDIIKKLDGEKIVSVNDLQAVIRGVKKNEALKLQYQRDGQSNTTEIYIPKATHKKDL